MGEHLVLELFNSFLKANYTLMGNHIIYRDFVVRDFFKHSDINSDFNGNKNVSHFLLCT